MFCPKCGYEVPENTEFCPKCGAKVNEAKPENNTSGSYFEATSNAADYVTPAAPVYGDSVGTGTLVCGVIALVLQVIFFFLPLVLVRLVLSIVAIVKACKDKKLVGKMPGKSKGGLICAIIALVLLAVTILLYVFVISIVVKVFNSAEGEFAELVEKFNRGEITEDEFAENFAKEILSNFGLSDDQIEEILEEGFEASETPNFNFNELVDAFD